VLKDLINEFAPPTYDPIKISVIRQLMDQLANDITGCQLMYDPSGLIFTIRYSDDDPKSLKGLIEKYCAENVLTTESDE
jgi:hypothetical protein